MMDDDKNTASGDGVIRKPCPSPVVAPYNYRGKRVLDLFLAAVLLLPISVVVGVAIVLIRLTSRGAAIYSQTRVGKDGHNFTMYKLRTMVVDAEASGGAVWAAAGDPRITRLGYVLRKLHIDEFPQIVNIIKGEMSFVGPRPERPEFVASLSEAIDGYEYRLLVRPGVTGFAQVNLPSDRTLDDVRRKVALDLEYIETASLGFDIRLLLATLFRFARVIGPVPVKFFGVRRMIADCPWAAPLGAAKDDEEEVVWLSGLFSAKKK
ncbi:MAG: sugar transferase [Thermoguttaceae bacterium]